jgi:hypothetical protein
MRRGDGAARLTAVLLGIVGRPYRPASQEAVAAYRERFGLAESGAEVLSRCMEEAVKSRRATYVASQGFEARR